MSALDLVESDLFEPEEVEMCEYGVLGVLGEHAPPEAIGPLVVRR